MWEKNRHHKIWYILLAYIVSFLFSTTEWQLHKGRVSACFVYCWVLGWCLAHSRCSSDIVEHWMISLCPQESTGPGIAWILPKLAMWIADMRWSLSRRDLMGKQPSGQCSLTIRTLSAPAPQLAHRKCSINISSLGKWLDNLRCYLSPQTQD